MATSTLQDGSVAKALRAQDSVESAQPGTYLLLHSNLSNPFFPNTHTNTSHFFLSFRTLQAQAQRLRLLVPHALHTRHQLRNRKILLCSTSRTKCSGRSRLRCPLQQLRPMGLCRPSGPLAHSLLSPRIQMPDQQQQSASCLLPIISK